MKMLKPPQILYIGVYTALIIWVLVASSSLRGSEFFAISALGLTAYSLMWAHYFNGFIRGVFFPESNTKTLYKITKYFVFFAIIAHPLGVSYVVTSSGFGIPPMSYIRYFGLGNFLYVALGMVSLLIFLSFDLKSKLNKKYQIIVEHLSNFAMLMITFHALLLGYVLQDNRYRIFFYFLAITLTLMMARLYAKEKSKTISIVGLILVAISLSVVSIIILRSSQ
ncbi:hypothetical protein A3F37_02650 [Candidatus Saccharibacteria bacterium RIFCSPHIGHO2_12_FULL_41_12]|nr:MAG: hypothetical protein A3F37_02650 [Candidatus Saccharibacteria bacterium RIFCSPHIGHO2_12_FULL_41_12]